MCYKKFFLWYNDFIFVEEVDIYAIELRIYFSSMTLKKSPVLRLNKKK